MPDIDGIDSFASQVFHSAQWPEDADLAGKRVAVIGTGASAIQIVPAIAEEVEHLTVFQRTAPYVVPRQDRAYTKAERLAFKHLPAVQRIYRTGVYWSREALVPGFVLEPKLAIALEKAALANIHRDLRTSPSCARRCSPTSGSAASGS